MKTTDHDLTDREFLTWLHRRLELFYRENPNADYMGRLRSIIQSLPNEITDSVTKTTYTAVCRKGNNTTLLSRDTPDKDVALAALDNWRKEGELGHMILRTNIILEEPVA